MNTKWMKIWMREWELNVWGERHWWAEEWYFCVCVFVFVCVWEVWEYYEWHSNVLLLNIWGLAVLCKLYMKWVYCVKMVILFLMITFDIFMNCLFDLFLYFRHLFILPHAMVIWKLWRSWFREEQTLMPKMCVIEHLISLNFVWLCGCVWICVCVCFYRICVCGCIYLYVWKYFNV